MGESTMANDECQEQKKVIQEAQQEGRTVHSAALMDICHLQELGVGSEVPETKKEVL